MQAIDAADREEWARCMRAQFSPPAMLHADASVKQDFFKPRQVLLVDNRKWGAREDDLLYEGLERFGLDGSREIVEALLPDWHEQTVRAQTARLLGAKDLNRYAWWRGGRAAVDRERSTNAEAHKHSGSKMACSAADAPALESLPGDGVSAAPEERAPADAANAS